MRILLLTFFVCLSVVSGKLTADDSALGDIGDLPNWGACRVPALPPIAFPTSDASPEEVEIFSGQARLTLTGNASFSEDISLVRGNRLLTAQGANYDRQTGVFSVAGEVEFRDPETRIRADKAELNQLSQELSFDNAEFELWSVPARGKSEYIKAEKNGKLRLLNVSYTSCPDGNNDWMLKASKIRIDQKHGIGTAKHARFKFKGVPFLYLPYISFPVTDQRKSGWLIPKIGSSQQRGFDAEVPYYWNIAPQFDTTITPRYMSKRGLQLTSDFRYLTERNEGILTGEILPSDNASNERRALVAANHTTNFTRDWRTRINAVQVSDSAYFEDFSSGLGNTSQTHLQQRADIEFFNDTWSALLRIENYQTIDNTIADADLPYATLPKLSVRGFRPNGWLGLQYSLDTEVAYFNRKSSVSGIRGHIEPEISLPKKWRFLEIEPAVAFDYTGYKLTGTAPGADDAPSRALPMYSLSTRTVFERRTKNRGWLQTLEPRLLYNYIPFRNQNDLPVFDTIEPTLNVIQLFRKNRFVGYDRLGDTNQLSVGITTRLISADDGDEFLNATIGQIVYFSDRDVTLPDGVQSDSSSSDYILELGVKLYENWRMRLGYQYNSDTGKTEQTEIRLNYRADNLKLANVSYRFRRDSLENIDVSAAWPVFSQWNLIGRYDYSILDSKELERFVGIEYSTCCWSIRGLWRRNLINRTGASDTSFAIQLQLKGLGDNTSAADRWLDRGILDYY